MVTRDECQQALSRAYRTRTDLYVPFAVATVGDMVDEILDVEPQNTTEAYDYALLIVEDVAEDPRIDEEPPWNVDSHN